MIGQGVFLKARVMTCNVGSPGVMLGAWLVAGVLALCGALTLAELGAALPESGGMYAFLRRAYGGGVAFAYGWMLLFVGSPASIAALASGGAIFFDLFSGHALRTFDVSFALAGVPMMIAGTQLAAIVLIAVMTAVNCAPAHFNGRLATASAALKIGMIVALTLAAFALGHGSTGHFSGSGAGGACEGVAAGSRGGVSGFAAALIGALYAYNGWHSLTLVAGEVKQPGRVLPAALIASVALVTVFYLGANAAFVYVLGPLAIANLGSTASVGVSTVEALFGPIWRSLAAVFLFASVAATLHVTIFTNARVTYAFAADVVGAGWLRRISGGGHVPVNAVLLNSLIAVVFVLSGTFDTLSNYLVFNSWLFFVAAGTAMFVLRRREPLLPRPYRSFGYPVIPALYVLAGTWLLIETAIGSPQASAIGLLILGLSVPVYFAQRRRGRLADSNRRA